MASKQQSGFTLIEVIVYIALFSILFTGVIIGAYSILESSGRNQSKALMQADGNFIAAKISWALSGAQSITVPAGGDLQIATPGGPTEFKMDSTNTDLLLSEDNNSGLALNNSNEKVTNLFFVKIDASGDKPEGVNYGFTLNILTPNGMPMSADFASTVYLRK